MFLLGETSAGYRFLVVIGQLVPHVDHAIFGAKCGMQLSA